MLTNDTPRSFSSTQLSSSVGDRVKGFVEVQVDHADSLSLTHQVGHPVMEGDQVPRVAIGGGCIEPQEPLLGIALLLLTAGSRQWSQCPNSASSTGKGQNPQLLFPRGHTHNRRVLEQISLSWLFYFFFLFLKSSFEGDSLE